MPRNIESKIESDLDSAKNEAEDVCKEVEELDKRIDELKAAISRLSRDDEVRAVLEANLSEKEAEKNTEQRKAKVSR